MRVAGLVQPVMPERDDTRAPPSGSTYAVAEGMRSEGSAADAVSPKKPTARTTAQGIFMSVRMLDPIQDDLAGLSAQHGLEPFFEFSVVESMRDDRSNVEPAFQHHGHLVPGLVHLAPINSFYREHVEDDLVPVNGDGFGRNAEQRNFAAVTHVIDKI